MKGPPNATFDPGAADLTAPPSYYGPSPPYANSMLLLDTNILYRWLMDLPLPQELAWQISKEGAAVSILSPWEMLIKHQIGKLDLPTLDVANDVLSQGFTLLPIQPGHLLALTGLPLLHRDPFDRLLLAQAKAEAMTLVTTDRMFSEYLPDVWVV